MSFYAKHVFICTNIKENNNNCCGARAAADITTYAKQKAKQLGLTKEVGFRISSSGCMGRCSEGPVLVVYPSGDWYTYKSAEDIDHILNTIAKNEIAHEFLLSSDLVKCSI